MTTLRGWMVMSWIMLPGVMFGGSLLLRRLTVGEPDPFQATWIRAFHAHGGVLIMLSILYYMFLDRTTLSARADERSVNEVVNAVRLAQPSISKHLRVLREVGLVQSRRDGRQIWYRTNAHAIRPLYEWAWRSPRQWASLSAKRISARPPRSCGS